MAKQLCLLLVPEELEFTPQLAQYAEVVSYLMKNNYVEMLDDDVFHIDYVSLEQSKCFLKHYPLSISGPEKITEEPIYKETFKKGFDYNLKTNKIDSDDSSVTRTIYDSEKLLTLLKTLGRKYDFVKRIYLHLPASPKFRWQLVCNKKNMKFEPDSLFDFCTDIDIEIIPDEGIESWRITDNKLEFPSPETKIERNFFVKVTIGYWSDFEFSSWVENPERYKEYPEDYEPFIQDYLIELKNDPSIVQLLDDLSQILGTKMIPTFQML